MKEQGDKISTKVNLFYENSVAQYIILMKAMVRGLVFKIFFSIPFILSTPKTEIYSLKIIYASERQIVRSALIISLIVGIISISIITYSQGIENFNIIIVGFFMSTGLAIQILSASMAIIVEEMRLFISSWTTTLYLFARNKPKRKWEHLQLETEMLWMNSSVLYTVPLTKLRGKIGEERMMKHIKEFKGELGYIETVTNSPESKLKFAEFAIDHIIDKLNIHDTIYGHTMRIGTWTYVFFLLIGTIIWLVTS